MFKVTTEGRDPLKLRQLCEEFCNDQWIPDHLLPHERETFVWELFERTVLQALKLLDVKWEE